ncbi:MAG: nucleotidyltransferase family protein [Oscillospiraceae bacterium]
MYRAAHEEPTLDGVLAAAKSKRYALSRIRRMTMCAALGVTAGMDAGTPPYARVLAIGAQGRELLARDRRGARRRRSSRSRAAGREPAGRSRRNICPDGGCARSLCAWLPRQRGATLRRRLAREPVCAVTGRVRKVFEILI